MKDLFNNKRVWAFLSENNIQIYIGYRGEDCASEKWYCVFQHIYTNNCALISEGSAWAGKCGNGNSPQEAFENAFMEYSGKKAFFGKCKDGKEVEVLFPIII